MWHKKARDALKTDKVTIGDYKIEEQAGKLKFYNARKEDFYRKGNPYRLLGNVGDSIVEFTFNLEDLPNKFTFDSLLKIFLTVNHCRTSANAVVNLMMNGTKVKRIAEAPPGNFGVQTFTVEKKYCKPSVNVMEIVLDDDSPGVYWFSDAKIEALFDSNKTSS